MRTSSSPLVDLRALRARPRALALMKTCSSQRVSGPRCPLPPRSPVPRTGTSPSPRCAPQRIGQAIYSVKPVGSPPPTYSCPGGTAPNSTQSTAGSIDSMPYFSSQGTALYFSSNRLSNGNNPGANGNFAIYQVTYPPTVSGSPGSQTDGAVQITFPAASGGSQHSVNRTRTATSAPVRRKEGLETR